MKVCECFQHPPVLEQGESISSSHIHDQVSHSKECLLPKRLRKEVGEIIRCTHERNDDRVVLHFFSNEEMSPINMFRARVMLRIVSQVAASLVVHAQFGG